MEWVKKLKDISIFKSYESIFNFNKTFDTKNFLLQIVNSLIEIDPENIFDYYHQIDEAIYQLDQLILSLAPFSYKDEAYELQNKFNKLRSFIEKIPNAKTSFIKFKEVISKNHDKDIDTLQTLILKDLKIFEKDKKKFSLFTLKDKEQVNKITLPKKTDNNQKTVSLIEKKISEFVYGNEKVKDTSENTNDFNKTLDKYESRHGVELKSEFQERIKKRDMLLQALLDIYHDKKKGYKLMLSIFRGLDVYRRMSLSGDSFNKDLFIINLKKSLTLYEDANLFKLVIEKNPDLKIEDVKKMIVDCLKIINKQIDKSRFKLYFDDKLNYRSGFNPEFQQKVEWLYLPDKRRPKRNLDELYTIKSVTDNLNKFHQEGSKSYSSFLSSRDIDICNKILASLHAVYYQDSNIRKFLIKIFHSLDNYDYNKHEYTEKYKEDYKRNFQNTVMDNNINCGLVRITIHMNPKINPLDIKNLIPISLKIMKEKIDTGFERKKKEDVTLQNSFNPMEKYYRIYDKKLFRIYKRV
ncbi:MAG TPA: hypothetical protein PK771_01390 [Spirochaetota bacterium]|nr:hypothetical protein [Spirochaetota bacterium]